MTEHQNRPLALTVSMFTLSFSLVLFELTLTRIFGVVLFASFAHLALAIALLGISLGAMIQQLAPALIPSDKLEGRLAWLSGAQALTTALAAWCATAFPLTQQFDTPPVHYAERSSIAWELIDPWWFALLLVFLIIPFTVAGLAFAAAFQHRKERIGALYGADLLGGAAGALCFVPLLYALPAPDVVWLVSLVSLLSATGLAWAAGQRNQALGFGLGASVALVLVAYVSGGHELLHVRFAAGYSEANVVLTRWTPLTRLALHVDDVRGPFMLLDNTSASSVITTYKARDQMAREAARAVVYVLHEPPARIAVLAASAGPEVATAQKYGHSDIDAIDIAAEIGEIVADSYPNSPVNPYVVGGTHRIWSDGRAAILHAKQPYDIIQMVHANLHSAAGLMSTAWSPNLLGTKEAFHTYFDQLTDDGTLSFSVGGLTMWYARAAQEALAERGAERPSDHILFVEGNQIFVLIKKRPWTAAERDRVAEIISDVNYWGPESILLDPVYRDLAKIKHHLGSRAVMTDDRPFLESPDQFWQSMKAAVSRMNGAPIQAEPADIIYNTLVLQTAFVLVAGALLVILPLLFQGTAGLTDLGGTASGLLYVCGLGYGYLSVETVLLHELVLFVGHPIYAVTVVIFSMLSMSGLGALYAQSVKEDRLLLTLRIALSLVLVLGAVQAFIVPDLLTQLAFGLPIWVRVTLTGLALAPLGFVMGMPFPLGLRLIKPEAASLVPWAWAFNGWTSVLATLGTIFASRIGGYSWAFGIALAAYAMSLLLAGRLQLITKRTS